jgi:ATP-dependent helicase/nuclease subunit B
MIPTAGAWRALRRPEKPLVFTIPPDAPFVDALAHGLSDDCGADPMALADVTVLLPTRRAIRALRDAFLRRSAGQSTLLPRLIALNDVGGDDDVALPMTSDDELPTPIDGLKRQLILTRLTLAFLPGVAPHRAAALAAELARLLDEVETERLDFGRLADLVPEDLAAHWQVTVDFLAIVTREWPKILAEEGGVDPARYRNLAFARQIAAWRRGEGARGPIVAAGSTGSIPATADLLAAVAGLPQGCVVLPGLDLDLDDAAWSALDECHPQFGMKCLLEHIGIDRDQVQLWPAVADHGAVSERRRLISQAMRPASTSDAWSSLTLTELALDGLSRIDAPTQREEAAGIALILRETLERPGETCALVTPDRELAERVAAEMSRWGVAIDDSAGARLDRTPPGAFLMLIADAVAEGLAPVPLLAMCKHPLAAAGLDTADFRRLTRAAEIALLRGPRPGPGIAGLRRVAAGLDAPADAMRWIDRLDATIGTYAAVATTESAPVSEILEAHMRCAEALAATNDTPGPLRVWDGEAGEAAARFAADFARAADALPAMAPGQYPALFGQLLSARVARPNYGRHPRLAILGPLEARLQRFDTVILGSLNEGTWPAAADADAWMSRPMRRRFGLQAPERAIGLAAHDIAQSLCAPRVVLTRAEKIDGTPSVPSRWLKRLDQVIAAAGLSTSWRHRPAPWLAWTVSLSKPTSFVPCAAPAPCPPLGARPRRLSVTRIEEWMRDPYGIYARFVLRLKALDPIDQEPSAAEFGTLLHAVLEQVVRERRANSHERLIEIGRGAFAALAARPGLAAFWWPRFQRIAAWIASGAPEGGRTATASFTEVTGQMQVNGPAGPFIVTAKADRIDVRDGRLAIIDYKTGTPPSANEVMAGYAPQLPLEAAIAAAGGFASVPRLALGALTYWHLHGRNDGGKAVIAAKDGAAAAAIATQGLEGLVAAFDRPDTCYRARPHPTYAPRFSDYGHLARVKEWSVAEEDAD